MSSWDHSLKRCMTKRLIQPNGCWYFSGKARTQSAIPDKGYPVTRVKINNEWAVKKVARVVAMTIGIPGEGPHICHKSNQPEYKNTEHHRWGTHKSNMRDKIDAGTNLAGEAHNLVKLSLTQVGEIRERAALGESHRSISEDYPVNRRQISRIISGARWSQF